MNRKDIMKKIETIKKLDIKTNLFLFLTNAEIVPYTICKNSEQSLKFDNINIKEVYVFDNYDEFLSYFKYKTKNIDEEMIEKAIYTRGAHGQIIANKALCERVALNLRLEEFYNYYSNEKVINEIHSRGKITPLEKVQEYESFDLCGPASDSRCKYFSNCHHCLLEYCSHKREYNRIDFKIVNSETNKILEKTP